MGNEKPPLAPTQAAPEKADKDIGATRPPLYRLGGVTLPQFGPLGPVGATAFAAFVSLPMGAMHAKLSSNAARAISNETKILTPEQIAQIAKYASFNGILGFTLKGFRGAVSGILPEYLIKEHALSEGSANSVTAAVTTTLDAARHIGSFVLMDLGNGHQKPKLTGMPLQFLAGYGLSKAFLEMFNKIRSVIDPDSHSKRPMTLGETFLVSAATGAGLAPFSSMTFGACHALRDIERLNPKLSMTDPMAFADATKQYFKGKSLFTAFLNPNSLAASGMTISVSAATIAAIRYGIIPKWKRDMEEVSAPSLTPPPVSHGEKYKAEDRSPSPGRQ